MNDPALPVPYGATINIPANVTNMPATTFPTLKNAHAPAATITTVPDEMVTSTIQLIRNWAHAGGTLVGFLMIVAYGITAIIHSINVDVSGADWRIGAVGGGIVSLSQVIDSWNNVQSMKINS